MDVKGEVLLQLFNKSYFRKHLATDVQFTYRDIALSSGSSAQVDSVSDSTSVRSQSPKKKINEEL